MITTVFLGNRDVMSFSNGISSDSVQNEDDTYEGIIKIISNFKRIPLKHLRLYEKNDEDYVGEDNLKKGPITESSELTLYLYFNLNHRVLINFQHYKNWRSVTEHIIFEAHGKFYKASHLKGFDVTIFYSVNSKNGYDMSTDAKCFLAAEDLRTTDDMGKGTVFTTNRDLALITYEGRELSKLETVFYFRKLFYRMFGIKKLLITDVATVRCMNSYTYYESFYYRLFATKKPLKDLSIYSKLFKYIQTYETEKDEQRDSENLASFRDMKVGDLKTVVEELNQYDDDQNISTILADFYNKDDCAEKAALLSKIVNHFKDNKKFMAILSYNKFIVHFDDLDI